MWRSFPRSLYRRRGYHCTPAILQMRHYGRVRLLSSRGFLWSPRRGPPAAGARARLAWFGTTPPPRSDEGKRKGKGNGTEENQQQTSVADESTSTPPASAPVGLVEMLDHLKAQREQAEEEEEEAKKKASVGGPDDEDAAMAAAAASVAARKKKKEEEEKKKEEERTPRTWLYTLIGAPLAWYYYTYDKDKKAILAGPAQQLVGCEKTEIIDLIRRSRLSSIDLQRVYAYLLRNGRRRIEPDKFGTVISDNVALSRVYRKEREMREQRERHLDREHRRRQNSELRVRRRMEAEQEGREYVEAEDESDDAIDAEEEEEEIERKKKRPDKPFMYWDVLCLFRNLPLSKKGTMEVIPMLIGVSILAEDMKVAEEWVEDDTLTERALLRKNRNVFTKMDLAWKTVMGEKNQDRPMSEPVLAKLLERMIQTGHVSAESLVFRSQTLPRAQFELGTAEQLASEMFRLLNAPKRSPYTPAPAEAAADGGSTGEEKTAGRQQGISLLEFKQAAKLLTDADLVKFWYLEDTDAGFFARWKRKFGLRMLMRAHREGYLLDTPLEWPTIPESPSIGGQ